MPLGIERRYQEIRSSVTTKVRGVKGRVTTFNSPISLTVIAGGMIGGLMVPAFLVIDNTYNKPARAAEAAAKAEQRTREQQAREAQLVAQQEAIRADYEQYDGVNLDRVAAQSYLFTLRDSANVASSREEVIGRVIARISKETGCPSIVLAYLPADSFEGPEKHEAYTATAICLPQQPQ